MFLAKPIIMSEAGYANQGVLVPSPNFDARPANEISLIVIHNISLPPSQYGGNGIIELFTNQLNPEEHPYYANIYQLRVSSHFLIRRNGHLIQFVSCLQRAWHAGQSTWQERERCNDFSVGIELEGSDFEAFEPAQYATLKSLIASLRQGYPISDIVGHSDIAPHRKTDPGPYFDWSTIERTHE
ncbi:MAG: 1,6-anhydro-N-acetylmuramyl-L-alanine amidase AmpD [Methylotenera sp.]|nr:1,6-anhydro-N-acetylmuramyl-L-alanine amidase AmpD [Methylotenera sp.]